MIGQAILDCILLNTNSPIQTGWNKMVSFLRLKNKLMEKREREVINNPHATQKSICIWHLVNNLPLCFHMICDGLLSVIYEQNKFGTSHIVNNMNEEGTSISYMRITNYVEIIGQHIGHLMSESIIRFM